MPRRLPDEKTNWPGVFGSGCMFLWAGLLCVVRHLVSTGVLLHSYSEIDEAQGLGDAPKVQLQATVRVRGVEYLGTCPDRARTYIGCNRMRQGGLFPIESVGDDQCIQHSSACPEHVPCVGASSYMFGRRLIAGGMTGGHIAAKDGCNYEGYNVWSEVELVEPGKPPILRCAYLYGLKHLSVIEGYDHVHAATAAYKSMQPGTQIDAWTLEDDPDRCVVGLADPETAVENEQTAESSYQQRKTVLLVLLPVIAVALVAGAAVLLVASLACKKQRPHGRQRDRMHEDEEDEEDAAFRNESSE